MTKEGSPQEIKRRPKAGLILTGQRISIPVVWVVIIAVFGVLRPDSFLNASTFSAILGTNAVLVFLTLALVVTLRVGDYDLSVAAVMTLSAMTVAVLNVQYDVNIVIAILTALSLGALIGAVNAFFAVWLGIDSFIVTLGVSTFLAGVILWMSNGTTVSGITPDLEQAVVVSTFLGIPMVFYYALALCVVLWYVFEFTGAGRKQLFVGKGREVARLSGVPVGKVRTASFVTCSCLSAAAGVLYAGTAGGADPTSGLTFLLPAFAAAFLGATTIVPGQFNPFGSLISAYFLVTGITGLQILGLQGYVTNLFYGGALVIAVAGTRVVTQGFPEVRRRRRSTKGSGNEATKAQEPKRTFVSS